MNVAAIASFNPHGDTSNCAQKWKKWLRSFELYSSAAGCKDNRQKRQLLLHSAGPEVQDIFDTLGDTGEDYETASEKLTAYFTPSKNVPYNRHLFRQETQAEGESIAQYVTRLRQLGDSCEFGQQLEDFIRDQVIEKCSSRSLRTKLLAESNLTLTKLLDIAQAKEASESRSAKFEGHETSFSVKGNHCKGKQKHYKQKQNSQSRGQKQRSTHKSDITCFRCGQKGHLSKECKCSRNIQCFKCSKMGHFASMCGKHREECRNPVSTDRKKKFANYTTSNEPNHFESSSETDEFGFSETDEFGFCVGKMATTVLDINGQSVEMIIDSGSSCNIINTEVKERLMASGVKFEKSCRIIHPYSSPSIKASVETHVRITHRNCSATAELVCIEGKSPPLLGKQTATDLNILKFERVNNLDDKTAKLEEKFPGITDGIGKLKGEAVKLHIDSSVPPVARKHIRVPFHLRDKVAKEIERLEKAEIIEKVSGPTEWVSPIVVVNKPKSPNEVRICIDMREPNKAILRTRHVTPTLDELIHDLKDAKVFSKIDLRAGYHQLCLHPDSRSITTFATHCGLYRYKRLIFGVNAAAEIFQHTIQSVIAEIEGARNVSDDIIIFGKDKESHDVALQQTLTKIHNSGLTINAKKCEFSKHEIKFFGHIFSNRGVSPDPDKVEALKNATKPQNSSEVRSFLGMAQYSSRFIPNFTSISVPLRNLTKKDSPWKWEESEEKAFRDIQDALTEDVTTSFFDPKKETTIYVDASPVGVAGILSQEDRVVTYASRSLTAVETRYSQTEREALAVVWACEHYNTYISGAPVTIVTDHQPLLGIWKKPNPPLRIQRWGLRLQPYDIKLIYGPGKDNPADFMSRHPVTEQQPTSREEKVAEEYIHFVVRESTPKAISEAQVRQETSRDQTLQVVAKLINTGRWHELKDYEQPGINYEALQSFKTVKDELSISHSDHGAAIMRGKRLVIPNSLQNQTLELAHEGHQGITKTKAFLRSKVWFPMIDKMVENIVSKCIPCQANSNRTSSEPLQMSELPRGAWQQLSVDFCGPIPTGEYLLVLIDEFSRYPVVHVTRSTSADTIMPLLDQTFAIFGYPETIKTDNGPPFQSAQWKNFLTDRGIKHRRITPLWPQANAQAESFNKPLMKAIRAAIVGGQPWRSALVEFLRVYRTTPHSTTSFSPFRLLFGRHPRTKLPESTSMQEKHVDDHLVRSKDLEMKQKMKAYADAKRHATNTPMEKGDVVMMKQSKTNKTTTVRDPQPVIVSKTKGTMITAQFPNGKEVTRNKSFFKPTPNVPPSSLVEQETEVEIEGEIENVVGETEKADRQNLKPKENIAERRPRRKITKPKRLIEEV